MSPMRRTNLAAQGQNTARFSRAPHSAPDSCVATDVSAQELRAVTRVRDVERGTGGNCMPRFISESKVYVTAVDGGGVPNNAVMI
jgi:hypothetical protein